MLASARMRSLVLVVGLVGCREQPVTPPSDPTSAPTPTATETAPVIARGSTSARAPVVPVAELDTSCSEDWDCVPAPACCPAPCTNVVINVKAAEKARAGLGCEQRVPCPSAGSCVTHQYLCVEGQCKLV